MKILIVDFYGSCLSLQRKLIEQGNIVYVTFQLKDSKKHGIIKKDNLEICKFFGFKSNRLIVANGKKDFEEAVKCCDFIINYNSIAGPFSYVDKILHKFATKYNKTIINEQFFSKHIELEYDRYLAKTIDFGFDKYETHKVFSYEDYLKIKSKKKFVIKAVNEKSKLINSSFRTIIPQSKEEERDIIKEDKHNHLRSGGAVLEEFIDGDEICLGIYWDGCKIVGDLIFVNQEYKGVWDGDLGGVLCGECGSCFYVTKYTKLGNRVKTILDKLCTYLRKNNADYHGFVDMNAMIKGKKIYLLEFTVRSGFPTEPCFSYIIQDYLEFLKSVATGSVFKGKVITDKPIVAVSMFGYGLPFITCAKNPITIKGNLFDNHIVLTSIHRLLSKNIVETKSFENPVICIYEGNTTEDARNKVYKTLKNIHSYGLVYRSDIGTLFDKSLTSLKNIG